VIIKEPKSLYQRFDSRKSMYLRNDEFTRSDENDDAVFYEKERPGPHLDAQALNTAAMIIKELIVEEKPVILDLMAGIDSHILPEVKPAKVMGLGLNAAELKKNKDLDDYVVHDLNRNPRLPFDNGSFDVVLNTVSVDYLTKPFEVFKDVGRVLKPGGLFLVLFSNRFFPEKVVNIWRKGSEDERVLLVEELFRKATFLFPGGCHGLQMTSMQTWASPAIRSMPCMRSVRGPWVIEKRGLCLTFMVRNRETGRLLRRRKNV